MTRDDVIRMVREAGVLSGYESELFQRIANLIAAAEREACAQVCDDIDTEYEGEDVCATWCSAAIRARNNNAP